MYNRRNSMNILSEAMKWRYKERRESPLVLMIKGFIVGYQYWHLIRRFLVLCHVKWHILSGTPSSFSLSNTTYGFHSSSSSNPYSPRRVTFTLVPFFKGVVGYFPNLLRLSKGFGAKKKLCRNTLLDRDTSNIGNTKSNKYLVL